MKVDRRTVDLSGYPDLVAIYLGMRVNALAGIKTLMGFGPRISDSVKQKPEGLLLHESLIYSVFPLHVDMRQYWRDFDSLERLDALRAAHAVVEGVLAQLRRHRLFWHEAYFMRGGMEAIYDDIPKRIGFAAFAPVDVARGPMFSARTRLEAPGEETKPVVIPETDLYSDPGSPAANRT